MAHHGMTNKLFAGRKAPFTFRTPVDNTCKVCQAFHFPWIEIILHLDKLIFKSLKIRRIRTVVALSLLIYFGFPQLSQTEQNGEQMPKWRN